jgi:hypothetical protein
VDRKGADRRARHITPLGHLGPDRIAVAQRLCLKGRSRYLWRRGRWEWRRRCDKRSQRQFLSRLSGSPLGGRKLVGGRRFCAGIACRGERSSILQSCSLSFSSFRSAFSCLRSPVLRLSRLCGSPDLAMDPDAFKDPEGEQDQHQK